MMLLACLCTLFPTTSAIQRGTRTSYAPPEGTGATVSVVQPGGTVDLQASPADGPEDEGSMAEIRRTTTMQKSTVTKTTKQIEVEGAQSFVTMPDGSKLAMTLVDGEWRVSETATSLFEPLPDAGKEASTIKPGWMTGDPPNSDQTCKVMLSLKKSAEEPYGLNGNPSVGLKFVGMKTEEGDFRRGDDATDVLEVNIEEEKGKLAQKCGIQDGDVITEMEPAVFLTAPFVATLMEPLKGVSWLFKEGATKEAFNGPISRVKAFAQVGNAGTDLTVEYGLYFELHRKGADKSVCPPNFCDESFGADFATNQAKNGILAMKLANAELGTPPEILMKTR